MSETQPTVRVADFDHYDDGQTYITFDQPIASPNIQGGNKGMERRTGFLVCEDSRGYCIRKDDVPNLNVCSGLRDYEEAVQEVRAWYILSEIVGVDALVDHCEDWASIDRKYNIATDYAANGGEHELVYSTNIEAIRIHRSNNWTQAFGIDDDRLSETQSTLFAGMMDSADRYVDQRATGNVGSFVWSPRTIFFLNQLSNPF